MIRTSKISLIGLISILLISMVAFPVMGSWYMSYNDLHNDAHNGGGLLTLGYGESWNYTTGGNTVCSSPIVDDYGRVLVGSDDNKLYCINSNGTLNWTYTTGGDVRSSACYDPSTHYIYFGSNDGYIYCLYSNGTLKWSYNWAGGAGTVGSPKVSGNYVYVELKDCTLFKLDKLTGEMIGATGSGIYDSSSSSLAFNDSGEIIIFTQPGGNLYAYSISNLNDYIWMNSGASGYGALVVKIQINGTYYELVYNLDRGATNYLECFWLTNGTLKWRHTETSEIYGIPLLVSAIDGSILYVTTDGYLKYQDAITGADRDSLEIANRGDVFKQSGILVGQSPTFLYIMSNDGYFEVINIGTKSEIFEQHVFTGTGGAGISIPCATEDAIYICYGLKIARLATLSVPNAPILTLAGEGTVDNPYFYLTWTEPTNLGNGTFYGYKLYISLDNTSFYIENIFNDSTFSYYDINVIKFVPVYYYVCGYNNVGNGEASNIINASIGLETRNLLPDEPGLIGQMFPFLVGTLFSMFFAIFLDRRFSLAMFAVVWGITNSVLVWLGALPIMGIGITALLFVAVIYMEFGNRGGGSE